MNKKSLKIDFFEFMIPTIMFKAIYGIFECFSRLTSFWTGNKRFDQKFDILS